jgi:Holliday junction resolvase
MSAANKAKGSKFESDVEGYLVDNLVTGRRLARAGSKDIGDVALTLRNKSVLVMELKNTKTQNMKEYLRQAEVESLNYETKYGNISYPVVVTKSRGSSIGEARVTMTLETLMEFLHGCELS